MSETYKVIIVDDESDVAATIAAKIDWASLRFTPPQFAANGLDGLELAEQVHPDVVMTDIKMPYMDGLELSRRLREEFPNIRIVLFSGFDEFEYAKEAVRLQAVEYILKPVDKDELTRVFTKIRDDLDQQLDAQRNIEKLESYYKESLPLLQESFFGSLMEGSLPADQLEDVQRDYEISWSEPYYCVLIFHTSTQMAPADISPMLLAVSVRKLLEARALQEFHPYFFTYAGNSVAIAQLSSPGEGQKLTDGADSFCRLAQSVCNANVSCGIGEIVDSPLDLSQSYAGARMALSYRVIYGKGIAINIHEIAPQEKDASPAQERENLREVFKQIRLGSREDAEARIKAYMQATLEPLESMEEYRFYAWHLVSELYTFARQSQLAVDTLFGSYEEINRIVNQYEKKELEAWILEKCLCMQKQLHENRSSAARGFVSRACDYVDGHYDDPSLGVETICQKLGLSCAYFSTTFKKETGSSFTSYLTEKRMQKALELLDQENEKTYIIAQRVGYTDPNYFSYVFKKRFGVSPSKYRSGKS